MVQNLEGSVKVGATGTIAALMTRELEGAKLGAVSGTAASKSESGGRVGGERSFNGGKMSGRTKNLVPVVDVRCGFPDKAWKRKKLGLCKPQEGSFAAGKMVDELAVGVREV